MRHSIEDFFDFHKEKKTVSVLVIIVSANIYKEISLALKRKQKENKRKAFVQYFCFIIRRTCFNLKPKFS